MKSEQVSAILEATVNLEASKSDIQKLSLREIVELFLEKEELFFEQQSDDIFVGKISSNAGLWDCYIQLLQEREQLLIYSILPFEIPEDKIPPITELIARINYGLIIGNFDLSQTEIAYKTSIDVEGSRLDIPLVNRLFYSNVVSVNRYLPAIRAFLEETLSPQQAIALVEGKFN